MLAHTIQVVSKSDLTMRGSANLSCQQDGVISLLLWNMVMGDLLTKISEAILKQQLTYASLVQRKGINLSTAKQVTKAHSLETQDIYGVYYNCFLVGRTARYLVELG